MNPSHAPETTPTLPIALEKAIDAASTPGSVRRPLTISSSFMMLAGLKKCRPTTRSGRRVQAAITSRSSVEVLLARMAAGEAIRSSSTNTCRFTSIDS